MKKMIVQEADRIFSEEPNLILPELTTIGIDWVIVESISYKDAIHQMDLYDMGVHPKQKTMKFLCDRVRFMEDYEEAKQIIYNTLFNVPDVGSIVIGIEALGYTSYNAKYNYSKKRYWVAEIIGEDTKFKFKRKFLKGKIDFTESNHRAAHGVYIYCLLSTNKIYEISSPVSNKHTNRYYCRVENGEEIRMGEQEVIMWLKDR